MISKFLLFYRYIDFVFFFYIVFGFRDIGFETKFGCGDVFASFLGGIFVGRREAGWRGEKGVCDIFLFEFLLVLLGFRSWDGVLEMF